MEKNQNNNLEIENRFNNNAICDIYIGKSAGKNLRETLRRAKSEVTIISPFLNGSKTIEQLQTLLDRDIKVNIVTKENEMSKPFFEKFVLQNSHFSKNKKILSNIFNLLLILFDFSILIFFIEIMFGIFFQTSILEKYINLKKMDLIGYKLLFTPIILLIIRGLLTMVKNKIKVRKFDYTIHRNLNLHILDKDFQLHSKIYIIDNAVAYLGSLNFTDSGFNYNHETRVKTSDKYVIANLNGVYEDLIKQPSIAISELGSHVYYEDYQ